MKNKTKLTPSERKFNTLYVARFNPAEPSDKLLAYLKNTKTTKGNFNGNYKETSISDLPIQQLEYLAYTCKVASGAMKVATRFQLFIKMYADLDTSDAEEVAIYLDSFTEDFPDTDVSYLKTSLNNDIPQGMEDEPMVVEELIAESTQDRPLVEEEPKRASEHYNLNQDKIEQKNTDKKVSPFKKAKAIANKTDEQKQQVVDAGKVEPELELTKETSKKVTKCKYCGAEKVKFGFCKSCGQ